MIFNEICFQNFLKFNSKILQNANEVKKVMEYQKSHISASLHCPLNFIIGVG